MHHIIVIGGNFAGLTSALELKRRLGYACKVTIISKLPYFIFVPSLIWIPFEKRNLEDITIPLEPILSKAQIELIIAEATEILPEQKVVRCPNKEFAYDYLIIATGPNWLVDQIDGMGLQSNISYIINYETAIKTRERWKEFIKNPGPVVIGTTQDAQFLWSAYEFVFNFEKQCRNAGIRDHLDITFITPEPYVGHLGIGGVIGGNFWLKKLLNTAKINYFVNTKVKRVTAETITLNIGSFPYKFCMLMPMFKGSQVVKNSIGLGNIDSLLMVRDTYQHKTYPNIFGIGSAIDYSATFKTIIPIGIAKTGYAAHVSAKTAVENIIRLIKGMNLLIRKSPTRLPELFILDAGDKELLALTLPLLKPRSFSLAFPNLINDFGKIAAEKYLMWQKRHGYSWLPP